MTIYFLNIAEDASCFMCTKEIIIIASIAESIGKFELCVFTEVLWGRYAINHVHVLVIQAVLH